MLAATAGVSPVEFWDYTLLEIFIQLEGYRKRELDAWRRDRFTAHTFYTVMVGSEGRIPIDEFLRLPDEEVKEEDSEDNLMALYQKGLNAFKS